MYFYVTEKIKHYHKVGIAEQLSERMKEYQTLIPDLECVYAVDLPEHIAKRIEKLFKKVLREYAVMRRGKLSECYNLKLKYIKEFILNSSIALGYPLVHIRYLNQSGGFSHTDRKSDRSTFKRRLNYSDKFFIYLDSLYFNKEIPLMNLKKVSPKKVEINLINKVTLEELVKKANWYKEAFEEFKFSNPLFDTLKNYNNFLINNTSMEKIITFLEKIIFNAIKEYLLKDRTRKPCIRLKILKNADYKRSTESRLFLYGVKQNFEHIDFDQHYLQLKGKLP